MQRYLGYEEGKLNWLETAKRMKSESDTDRDLDLYITRKNKDVYRYKDKLKIGYNTGQVIYCRMNREPATASHRNDNEQYV